MIECCRKYSHGELCQFERKRVQSGESGRIEEGEDGAFFGGDCLRQREGECCLRRGLDGEGYVVGRGGLATNMNATHVINGGDLESGSTGIGEEIVTGCESDGSGNGIVIERCNAVNEMRVMSEW